MEWYEKAAEQGLAVAQFNLGKCYENVGKVFIAADWYQKAADQGMEIAEDYLERYLK